MKLSELQKYILKQVWQSDKKLVNKEFFKSYYNSKPVRPKEKDIVDIITKSIDRLIEKDLLVGFGYKTASRWFLQRVSLTRNGRKYAKELFNFQQKLPFKKLKISK